MKNKLNTILICIIFLSLCLLSFAGCKNEEVSNSFDIEKFVFRKEDNLVYFGFYPQTLKKDGVKIDKELNSNGFYLGSDGEFYAKVLVNFYSIDINYKFSNGEKILNGVEYYFMVQPIRWRILSESNGKALLLCDSIIESRRFDDEDNNYRQSEIREWLNGDFLNNAFNSLQRDLIESTTVDNSAESTGYIDNEYACADTEDKVFLLSYKDLTNDKYQLSDDKNRQMITSDYTRAKGVDMYTSAYLYGNGSWWLRSPRNVIYNSVKYVCHDGYIYRQDSHIENYGVVPVLQIKL